MTEPAPRLLLAVTPEPEVAAGLADRLLGIPWAYLDAASPPDRSQAEVLLVGSRRLLADFDPATTPKLVYVQRLFTGVDDLPFDRFPDRIQIVGNTGAFAPYVAEQAMLLALAAARQIVPAQAMIRAGKLRPAPEQRVFLGTTALILGYGEIGRAIAERLRGFGVRVVGLNRTGRMAAGADAMYPADRLLEAVGTADLVFDARPLTLRTRGSIDARALAAMRANAIYVNVGRAATADEEALYRHLEAHPEFRVGLDPWWDEDFVHGTFPLRFPFPERPNFVATPHSAGYGTGGPRRAFDFAVRRIAEYFRTGRIDRPVDRSDYVAPTAPPGETAGGAALRR
jgi:phosphoglycerate dehydrogenase-like enzyme